MANVEFVTDCLDLVSFVLITPEIADIPKGEASSFSNWMRLAMKPPTGMSGHVKVVYYCVNMGLLALAAFLSIYLYDDNDGTDFTGTMKLVKGSAVLLFLLVFSMLLIFLISRSKDRDTLSKMLLRAGASIFMLSRVLALMS